MRRNFISSLLLVSLMAAFIAAFNAKVVESKILKKGLVIYYSFDKDTVKKGEVKDLSGNGNDGVLKTKNLEVVKGKVKEGMEFPGTAIDYIAVKNHHYKAADIEGITLAAWIKVSTRSMIASWDRSEFFRFTAGDDQLGNMTYIAFDTCCGIHDWHGKTKVTDGKWHHVLALFDGKARKKKIYVDGKLDAETDAPHAKMGKAITRYGFIGIGSEAGAFDGGTGPTGFPFNGIMDEFVLYDRGLTEKECKEIYEAKGFKDIAPAGKLSLTWGEVKASR
ncbi:TPA: LamG domain-containing protein [Candidatus Poribacteria bacterium]|nr:LamG domain-containing protein [Candidatus Poribacteria bacterium]